MAKGNEIAVKEFNVLAPGAANLAAVAQDNLEEVDFSLSLLDRIGVPSGGGLAFSIVNADGEEVPAVELNCIIAGIKSIRVYWEKSLDDAGNGGTPPDCFSDDSKVGTGYPGGDCKTCPLNDWGSDPKGGKGKACGQRKLLFLYLPDDTMPRVLSVPPSSLKAVDKYLMRLTNAGKRYWEVVTRVTLAKKQNTAGIAYSELQCAMAGSLSAEQITTMNDQKAALAVTLGQSARELIEKEAAGVAAEYAANAETDDA